MRSSHRRLQQGSALMLAPAGILVLVLLAAISVDSAIAFMGQRELQNAAAAAANDAVTVAIPEGQLQAGDRARPDATQARAVVDRSVRHSYGGGLVVTGVETVVDGDTVTVTIAGTVPYIFANAVPGVRHVADVKARSSAQVRFR